jgi:hypothetical protein
VEIQSARSSITVDPSIQGGKNNLKSGSFEGPVTIKITRNERDDGSAEGTTSVYTAKGDHMLADFTASDKTVILDKNVVLTGSGATFNGTANASRAIIHVNDDLQPIRYEFVGEPATTRIKTGGRR